MSFLKKIKEVKMLKIKLNNSALPASFGKARSKNPIYIFLILFHVHACPSTRAPPDGCFRSQ